MWIVEWKAQHSTHTHTANTLTSILTRSLYVAMFICAFVYIRCMKRSYNAHAIDIFALIKLYNENKFFNLLCAINCTAINLTNKMFNSFFNWRHQPYSCTLYEYRLNHFVCTKLQSIECLHKKCKAIYCINMISFSGEMRTDHDDGANDDRWNCDLHDTL